MEWEYERQEAMSPADLANLLNGWGVDGWELVTVIAEDLADGRQSYWAFFKRQKK